jgi:type I restriction enzyme, R subunit
MIATGTDIKPLEALVFMRAVRSRVLFEQMLGRGTRIISETDFQDVTITPNARKTRFVIVDAVGVTEQELIDTGTVERKRSLPLKSLLESVAVGAVDDELLTSLARRLSLLEKRLSGKQRQEIQELLDVPAAPERFANLKQLAHAMLDAVDVDRIQEESVKYGADPSVGLTPEEYGDAKQVLVRRAVMPLTANPDLRAYLLEREILLDETSQDEVLVAGMDLDATQRARNLVESFQEFIQQNKDEITALQILFSRPYAHRLEFGQVRELADRLREELHLDDPLYMTEELWRAYTQLEKDRVHGAGERRILSDLVSLVRHAAMDEELEPYAERVARRYQEWLEGVEVSQPVRGDLPGRPYKPNRPFTPEQRWWLDEIARHIGINVSIKLEDLNAYGFQQRGGLVAARRLFGEGLPDLLEEFNVVLSR